MLIYFIGCYSYLYLAVRCPNTLKEQAALCIALTINNAGKTRNYANLFVAAINGFTSFIISQDSALLYRFSAFTEYFDFNLQRFDIFLFF